MKIIHCSWLFLLLSISLFVLSPIYAQESENGVEYVSSTLVGSPEDIRIELEQTRQFLVNNPNHLEERANECAYLTKLKLLDEAELCLEKASADFPNDPVIQGNLGALYFYRGDFDSAKTQTSIAYNLDPDDLIIHSNLLAVRVMVGDDPDKILEEINELLQKDYKLDNLFLTTAKLLNDKNQPSDARKFLGQIEVKDTTSIKYFTQLGISYALEGDFTNAKKYLLQGFERDPNDIGILKNLGIMYSNLGDETNDIEYYYQSVGYYESILQLDPDNSSANEGLDYSAKKIQNIYQTFYLTIYGLAAAVFGFVISVIWKFGYDNKKLEATLQLTQDDKKRKQVIKKILITKLSKLFLLGAMIIIAVLVSISLGLNIPLNAEWDMANWTATIIEIGIGILIAIMILTYELSKQSDFSKQQKEMGDLVNDINVQQGNMSILVEDLNQEQTKISKVVDSIKTIEKQQSETTEELLKLMNKENERIAKWKERFGNLIHEDLSSIKVRYDALEDWIKEYQEKPTPELKSNIIRNGGNNGDTVQLHTKNILKFLPEIKSYFDDPVLATNISSLSTQYANLFFSLGNELHWTSEGLDGLLLQIKEMQKYLDRDLKRLIDEGAHKGE